MSVHYNLHAFEYSCMGSLYASDELRELFIVLDLTLDTCLQLDRIGPHHLRQVERGFLVFHHPCLHVINNNMQVRQDACSSSTSLMPFIEMDECLMHGTKLRVQHSYNCVKGQYFI